MIERIQDLTEEQKQYIIDNYHNSQTWKISEDLNVKQGVISDFAEKKKLKKDKDFIIIRKQNKLTLEQCEFIIKNYEIMSNKDIIKKLGINYEDLRAYASRRKLNKIEKFKDSMKYTEEQIKLIKDNYSFMQNRDLSKLTGIDEKNIPYLANKFGLVKDKSLKKMNRSELTFEQKKFIKDNYSTMKTEDICKKINLEYNKVKGYASNLGLIKEDKYSKNPSHYFEKCLEKIQREDYNIYNFLGNELEPKEAENNLYKSKYGKYKVNQNYFEVIDNEWKAYWLGFMYADGTNQIKRNNKKNKMEYTAKLTLSKIDKYHVEKLKNSIQTDSPIKNKEVKLKGKTFYSSTLNICNRKICEDLNNLGCIPNKSLILKFPTEKQVPNYLIRHFIRGYFDGDGCIHINLEKRNVILSFMGTYDFLNSLKEIFEKELNISKVKIVEREGNKAVCLSYGSIISVEKIYKYLYKDCNIYLQRKLDKFNTLLCLD